MILIGGDDYHYDINDPSSGYEVPLAPSESYTSHSIQKTNEDGTVNDAWKFCGWQYSKEKILFDGEHKIEHIIADGGNNEYLSISQSRNDQRIDNIDVNEGITMIAQWKYRQAFIPQVYDIEKKAYVEDNSGGVIEIFYSNASDEDKEIYGKYGQAYFVDGNTYIEAQVKTNASYIFRGWYNDKGELISSTPAYSYTSVSRQENIIYARFDTNGETLNINNTVIGDEIENDKYFETTVEIQNAKPSTKYKITNLDTTQLTVDGKKVYNPQIIETDSTGNGIVKIYIKNGQTGVIASLPKTANFVISQTNYENSGYKTTIDKETGIMSSENTVNILNKRIAWELQVTKNGLQDSNDINSTKPLKNIEFSIYLDPQCNSLYSKIVTDEEGKQTFGEKLIMNTEYYLKETKVNSGYSADLKIYKLQPQENGIYIYIPNDDGTYTTSEKLQLVENSNNKFNITFTNLSITDFPNSGAIFTDLNCKIIGILLIMLSVIIKSRCKKKSKARVRYRHLK